MEDVLIKLRELMSEQLGLSEDLLPDTARFKEDLGVDSLDLYELFTSTEKLVGIDIPDEVAEKIARVGDLVAYVKQQKA